jgi:DNA polymerase-3 subunit alpha
VKSKFSKNGTPCGFVTLEDFEGSGELALFGEEWAKWKGMFNEASTIYVTGKAVQKFRGSNIYDIRIGDIQFMQTVKEKSINRLTIVINGDTLDDAKVNDLVAAIEAAPGDTSLYLQIHDANGNLQLRSRKKSVDVGHQLIQFLDETDGMNYFIN